MASMCTFFAGRANTTICEFVTDTEDEVLNDLPTDKITYLGVDYRLTNGSTIYFMDSKQAKIYSEENTTWYDV